MKPSSQNHKPRAASQLALFDIDGTMVRMWEVHEKVYASVVEALYGVKGFNFRAHYRPGETNEQVILSNLLHQGYSEQAVRQKLQDVGALMSKYYLEYIRRGDITVLPGVVPLLDSLRLRGVLTGIVTGNRGAIADMILNKAGIASYFHFVSSSDSSTDREGRILSAIAQAEKLSTQKYRKDRVYFFDDSDGSIPVSRKLGIKSVAVATGEIPKDRLKALGPDYLLDDLSNTNSILEVIMQ